MTLINNAPSFRLLNDQFSYWENFIPCFVDFNNVLL